MAAKAPELNPARAAEALRAFFLAHPEVQIREAGQPLARLGGAGSGYALHPEAHRLVGHFWSGEANLVRRIVGLHAAAAERLELEVMRLGQARPARLTLTPALTGGDRAGDRVCFRQALVAAAGRDWPGWRALPDGGGERARWLRLLFRRERRLLACLAMAETDSAADVIPALAHALVWAERCRERHPGDVVAGLRLVLPAGAEPWIRLLRTGLRPAPAIDCFHWDASAAALDPIALSDAGNTCSVLRRAAAASSPDTAGALLLARVRRACPQAIWETSADGVGWISVYGLEVARESPGMEGAPFVFGCGVEQTPLGAATEELFSAWLATVGAQRVAGHDARLPFYAAQPERWLAHLLRHDPAAFDAQLDGGIVYSGIPIATPAGTGVLDLLARDRQGRLVVIEVKTSEDPTFPLQALTYWLQVRRHQEAGDFERLGYFPGQRLSPQLPQLWLVAPALRWHPDTPLLLRWMQPEVPCDLIGLNEEWRQRVQVVFRRPAS